MTMNKLANDYIAIDTNIFIGLLNPQNNTEDHIEKLLSVLYEDRVYLIVDKGGKIWGEYTTEISNKMRNGYNNPNYNELLRGWLHPERELKTVDIGQHNEVREAIQRIIGRGNTKDAAFVCVAIVEDRVLVTNDRRDILDGGNKRDARRGQLLEIARKRGSRSAKIYGSQEAYKNL